MLIGREFRPFYESDRGTDLGVTTWPPDRLGAGRRHGLGLARLRPRPEPDLSRHRQSRPWNPEPRPGDNKWTTGIFARNPDTGEARWFYQW